MVSVDVFRRRVMELPGVVELPHVDRTKFRRRIDLCTLYEPNRTINLLLTMEDQAAFSAEYPGVVYPVPNGFARMGWTTVELDRVEPEVLWAALLAAYERAA